MWKLVWVPGTWNILRASQILFYKSTCSQFSNDVSEWSLRLWVGTHVQNRKNRVNLLKKSIFCSFSWELPNILAIHVERTTSNRNSKFQIVPGNEYISLPSRKLYFYVDPKGSAKKNSKEDVMIFHVFSRPLHVFQYTNKNILWGAKIFYRGARFNPWLNSLKKLRFKCGICTLHVFPKKQHLKNHDVTKYFGGISDLVDETYTALDFYVVECTVLSLIYPPTFYCPAPFRKKSSTFSILRKWANLSSF